MNEGVPPEERAERGATQRFIASRAAWGWCPTLVATPFGVPEPARPDKHARRHPQGRVHDLAARIASYVEHEPGRFLGSKIAGRRFTRAGAKAPARGVVTSRSSRPSTLVNRKRQLNVVLTRCAVSRWPSASLGRNNPLNIISDVNRLSSTAPSEGGDGFIELGGELGDRAGRHSRHEPLAPFDARRLHREGRRGGFLHDSRLPLVQILVIQLPGVIL